MKTAALFFLDEREYTMDYNEIALKKHAEWRGKLSVESKAPITSRDELSVAYTPGVAAPCLEISKDESLAYTYTGKKPGGLRIAFSGAGAAGISIAKMFLRFGFGDIILAAAGGRSMRERRTTIQSRRPWRG